MEPHVLNPDSMVEEGPGRLLLNWQGGFLVAKRPLRNVRWKVFSWHFSHLLQSVECGTKLPSLAVQDIEIVWDSHQIVATRIMFIYFIWQRSKVEFGILVVLSCFSWDGALDADPQVSNLDFLRAAYNAQRRARYIVWAHRWYFDGTGSLRILGQWLMILMQIAAESWNLQQVPFSNWLFCRHAVWGTTWNSQATSAVMCSLLIDISL